MDKRQAGLAAVRDAHAKVKDVAERSEPPEPQYRNGNDYAQSKVEQTARDGTGVVRRAATDGASKAVGKVRDVRHVAKEAKQGVESAQNASGTARQQTTQGASKQAAQKTVTRTAATTKQVTAATGRQAASSATGITRAAKGTIKQGDTRACDCHENAKRSCSGLLLLITGSRSLLMYWQLKVSRNLSILIAYTAMARREGFEFHGFAHSARPKAHTPLRGFACQQSTGLLTHSNPANSPPDCLPSRSVSVTP
ncbi:MAG: hypothetical protein LBL86_06960 [Coriobacteriales bacterium]|nr:hypothetical protein [Coriobacteriales bacterium]